MGQFTFVIQCPQRYEFITFERTGFLIQYFFKKQGHQPCIYKDRVNHYKLKDTARTFLSARPACF
jgi:hypothetical protein